MLNKNLIKWQCEKGSRRKTVGKTKYHWRYQQDIIINFKNINRNEYKKN